MKKRINFLQFVVVLALALSFTACNKDDVKIDYTQGIVGTWVADDNEWFEVLIINADGSALSSGMEDGVYWQGVKGNWTLSGNRLKMIFEDNDNFDGTIELVAKETLATTSNDGERIVYRYAETSIPSKYVGIWTTCANGYAEALEIKADGSLISMGRDEEGYMWLDTKGKMVIADNIISLTFEDGDDIAGQCQIIDGESMVITEGITGNRYVYTYCKNDISQDILGMWFMQDQNITTIMHINENNKLVYTGAFHENSDYNFIEPSLSYETSYKLVGDLFYYTVKINGEEKSFFSRLRYDKDRSAYGDVLTFDGPKGVTSSFMRVKESLDLAGKKYGYTNVYVTSVKGLDKDITFMDFTVNFSKMDGSILDKALKAMLYTVEFPDANTIKYSYTLNNETKSLETPIVVDGNKVNVKLSTRNAAFRDNDLYMFQDKYNTQMHIYMSKYALINFMGNMQVIMMSQLGKLDLTDQAAVDAVFKSIEEAVESINISFILKPAK